MKEFISVKNYEMQQFINRGNIKRHLFTNKIKKGEDEEV